MSGYALWNQYTNYVTNDIVVYDAILYVALANVVGLPAPPTNAAWAVVGGGGGGSITSITSNPGSGITIGTAGTTRIVSTNLSSPDGRLTLAAGTGTELVLTNNCPASVSAGTGLNSSGSNLSGITLSLPNVGTAGTYAYPTSVITDAQGRVSSITAGSAPVASLNSQTGSVSLTSTGGSIVITNPVAGQINVEGASLSGYVPYTGATTTLNLGTQDVICEDLTGSGALRFKTINYGSDTVTGNFANRLYSSYTTPSGNNNVDVWTFDAFVYKSSTYILTTNTGEGNSGMLLLGITQSGAILNVVILAGTISGGSVSVSNNNTGSVSINYSYSGHASSGTGFSILEQIVVTP